MRVSVFGLGYVGCVSAASLARAGHLVVGVDINAEKVAMVGDGRSPIVEPGMDELVAQMVAAGRLTATTDSAAAVGRSDLALICVGTPGLDAGQPDTAAIRAVGQQIGRALAGRSGPFTVVLRSTALPGTTEQILIPALRGEAGAGAPIQVAVNPEFMREGSAIADFDNPPIVLVGSEDSGSAAVVRDLYAHLRAPVVVTSYRTAEAAKYASNAFHALKVCFANEVAAFSASLGADAADVMRIFALDRQLNVSEAYLRPGFAFGGSCLPKDVRALVWSAKAAGLDTPLVASILVSNQAQVQRGVDAVLGTGKRRVGVVGLAFKPGTDDVRESPVVALVQALLADGCQVGILDTGVGLARITGANRRYIERAIPRIETLLRRDVDALLEDADVLVIGTATALAARAMAQAPEGCTVIDLAGGAICGRGAGAD
jgi:GDP-mannose 6-dehydrogenase